MEPTTDKFICLNCGYDLRGTPGDVCSECGKPFNREDYKHSVIPWERAAFGVWKFPMTLIATTLWKKRIRADVHRDLNLKSAKRFSYYVAILCMLPLLAVFSLIQVPSDDLYKAFIENSTGTFTIFGALNAKLPTSPVEANGFGLIHGFNLLMGMAFKGLWGYAVGVLAIIMWTCDWVRTPGATLVGFGKKAFRQGAANQAKVEAMGHYLSGPMGMIGLFFWIAFGFQILCAAMDFPNAFKNQGEMTVTAIVLHALSGISLLLSGICLYCMIERVYQCNVSAYDQHSAGVVWTVFALFVTFGWRLVFWVVLVPCFIGFSRLILESLLWAR